MAKPNYCYTCGLGEPEAEFYDYKSYLCKKCCRKESNKRQLARTWKAREARRLVLLEKAKPKPAVVDDFPSGFVAAERLTVPVDRHCPLLRQFGFAVANV